MYKGAPKGINQFWCIFWRHLYKTYCSEVRVKVTLSIRILQRTAFLQEKVSILSIPLQASSLRPWGCSYQYMGQTEGRGLKPNIFQQLTFIKPGNEVFPFFSLCDVCRNKKLQSWFWLFEEVLTQGLECYILRISHSHTCFVEQGLSLPQRPVSFSA